MSVNSRLSRQLSAGSFFSVIVMGLTVSVAPAFADEEPLRRLSFDGSVVTASTEADQSALNSVSPQASSAAARANQTIVVNQDIRSLLRDFSKRLGLQVKIATSVRGTVKNKRLPGDPEEFLKALARDHAIGWFYDGPVLHIHSTSDYATRLISLGKFNYDRLVDQLKEAGLSPERYPLRELEDANAMIVTAPPEYIARIEVIMEAMRNKDGVAGDGVRMVRHGRVVRILPQ